MNYLRRWIFSSGNDYKSLLPRLIVGLVFLSEGIQKFLFPELVGSGRFMKIGFQNPDFWAGFVASFEIVCGFFLIVGLLVRVASLPLLAIMVTAIISTKIPILVEKGFWSMAHESRTDFSMTLLLVYIIVYGASKPSIDFRLGRKKTRHR